MPVRSEKRKYLVGRELAMVRDGEIHIDGCRDDSPNAQYEDLSFNDYYTCEQRREVGEIYPSSFRVEAHKVVAAGLEWKVQNSLLAIRAKEGGFSHKPNLIELSDKLLDKGFYISWGSRRSDSRHADNDCKFADNTIFAAYEDALDFGILQDANIKGDHSLARAIPMLQEILQEIADKMLQEKKEKEYYETTSLLSELKEGDKITVWGKDGVSYSYYRKNIVLKESSNMIYPYNWDIRGGTCGHYSCKWSGWDVCRAKISISKVRVELPATIILQGGDFGLEKLTQVEVSSEGRAASFKTYLDYHPEDSQLAKLTSMKELVLKQLENLSSYKLDLRLGPKPIEAKEVSFFKYANRVFNPFSHRLNPALGEAISGVALGLGELSPILAEGTASASLMTIEVSDQNEAVARLGPGDLAVASKLGGRYQYLYEGRFGDPNPYLGTVDLLIKLGCSWDGVLTVLSSPGEERRILKEIIFSELGKANLDGSLLELESLKGLVDRDLAEVEGLLNRAVDVHKELGLIPGSHLRPEQLSQLREAILWPIKEKLGELEVWSLALCLPSQEVADSYRGSTLVLNEASVRIQEELVVLGKLVALGESILRAKSLYQIGEIKIGQDSSLTVELSEDMFMPMLLEVLAREGKQYAVVIEEPLTSPEIGGEGVLRLKTGGNALIQGKVDVRYVEIEVGDEFYQIPGTYYRKLVEVWSKDSQSREELTYEFSLLRGREGIRVWSKHKTYLAGTEVMTEGKAIIDSAGTTILDSIHEISQDVVESEKEGLFSNKSSSHSHEEFRHVGVKVRSGQEAIITSQEGTKVIGANIKGGHGSEIRAANNNTIILPGLNIKKESYKTNKEYWWKELQRDGMGLEIELVPSQMQVSEGWLTIRAGGKVLALASEFSGEVIYLDSPEEVEAGAMAEVVDHYHRQYKKVFGFSTTANSGELSASLGYSQNEIEGSYHRESQVLSKLKAKVLKLRTPVFKQSGANIEVDFTDSQGVQDILVGVVYNLESGMSHQIELTSGIKLGIQSSLGNLVNSGQGLGQADGAINQGFAALRLYSNLFSMKDGGAYTVSVPGYTGPTAKQKQDLAIIRQCKAALRPRRSALT